MPTAFEPFDYLGSRAVRWTVGDSTFEAVPEIGARLMRWAWRGHDLLHWPGDLTASEQIAEAYGGNPLLFPFPARCFVGGQPYQWIAPDGVRRPMPMHGVARQGRFAVIHLDEQGFTATFCPSEEARGAYPFDYVFSVAYRFASDQVRCVFTLENNGDHPIPWSAGHHFFFRVPLIPGLGIAGHRVHLEATRACQVKTMAAGRIVPLPPFPQMTPLEHPLLADAVIHYGLRSNAARLLAETEDEKMEITLYHGADAVPPPAFAFVTWSPSLDGPFYCIEPWMGPSNAPEHQTGLHWIAPGKRGSHTVTIQANRSAKNN